MSKKDQFLKLRRSAVPGKIPDTSSIDFGEIALNTYDGLAFMKRSGSSGEEVIAIGASSVSASYALTASYFVTSSVTSASYSVTASYVIGQSATASYALTASHFLGTLFQIATGSTTASVDVNTGSVFLIKNNQRTIVSVDNTGSLTTSGSVSVNTQGTFDRLFSVSNNSTEYFKINGDGVMVLHQYSTPPTAVSGGFYMDIGGNVYVGE